MSEIVSPPQESASRSNWLAQIQTEEARARKQGGLEPRGLEALLEGLRSPADEGGSLEPVYGPEALAALGLGPALLDRLSRLPLDPAGKRTTGRPWLALAALGELMPDGVSRLDWGHGPQLERLLGLAREDLLGGADGLWLRLAGPGLHRDEAALLERLSKAPFDACLVRVSTGSARLELPSAGPLCKLVLERDPWRDRVLGEPTAPVDWASLRAQAQRSDQRMLVPSSLAVARAGGGAVQELSYLLLALEATVRGLQSVGMQPATIAPRIGFEVAVSSRLFQELCKLRALRRLWSAFWSLYAPEIDQPACSVRGVSNVSELNPRDPWNNLLRTTYQGLAAILGGVDALVLAPFDEPRRQRGALGQRLARNQHTLLYEEAGLGRVADPAAGAYYPEERTEALCAAAWALWQDRRQRGGIEQWLDSGDLNRELAARRERAGLLLARRKRILVGLNDYAPPPSDPVAPGQALECIPAPGLSIPPRLGADFAALAGRSASEPEKARVFLLNLGRQRDHHPRASFIEGLLAVAGIGVVHGTGAGGRRPTEASGELWQEFVASGLDTAIVCGQDEETKAALPLLLDRRGDQHKLLVAGRFPLELDAWRAAGLSGSFALGDDSTAFLALLLDLLGLEATRSHDL